MDKSGWCWGFEVDLITTSNQKRNCLVVALRARSQRLKVTLEFAKDFC